jgi:hypothetical protein
MKNSPQWRAECEAREWIARYKKRAREHGAGEARGWWLGVLEDIEKKRGKAAAEELKELMNAQSSKNRRES